MELLCTNPNRNRHRNVAFNVGNDVSEEKSKRQKWSKEETDAVKTGYNRYKASSTCWKSILFDKEFQTVLSKRTNTQLKDKITNLKNNGEID